jgi:hypothetical protein
VEVSKAAFDVAVFGLDRIFDRAWHWVVDGQYKSRAQPDPSGGVSSIQGLRLRFEFNAPGIRAEAKTMHG